MEMTETHKWNCLVMTEVKKKGKSWKTFHLYETGGVFYIFSHKLALISAITSFRCFLQKPAFLGGSSMPHLLQ